MDACYTDFVMTQRRWHRSACIVVLASVFLASCNLDAAPAEAVPAEGVPAEGGANRLAGSSSPYLLLHQHNPVDWYPWGEEALAKARREDKPIFLSVGYATCYWCHVMERESFSDRAIAAFLNQHFVAIKVDREQRPDLDEVYMTATQLMTGRGGWPNSVFLTPELKPFYAGTYFPPYDVSTPNGATRPGFSTLLTQLHDAWVNRRAQVEAGAEELTQGVRRVLEAGWAGTEGQEGALPTAAVVSESLRALASSYDREYGGFGSARSGYQPKFPSPANLLLLLDLLEAEAEETSEAEEASENGMAEEMLRRTLDRMARGGMYDQLGGGFHRYSTDRPWRVPHFEKMLYDQAWLLEIYARYAVLETERPELAAQARRVVLDTATFLARELTGSRGELWSAIDAETNGREGEFYVWTPMQLQAQLQPSELARLAPLYGLDGAAFFRPPHGVSHWVSHGVSHGAEDVEAAYVLYLTVPLGEDAASVAALRSRLLAARDERKRPRTDDKVLTDWNGMAIAGLATAGRLLRAPELVHQAARAAEFSLAELAPGEPETTTLLHAWRQGKAEIPAMLADYANLVHGLLALHAATGEARWLQAARRLTEEQIVRLRAPHGGFFVAAARDDVLFRSQDPYDGALPSANGVALLNLLELYRRTGEERWLTQAEAALRAFGARIQENPAGLRTLSLAAWRYRQLVPGSTAIESFSRPVSRLRAEALQVVEDVELRLAGAATDGWRAFELRFRVAEGWHLNANPASLDFLIPTTVEALAVSAGASAGVQLRGLVYPEGTLDGEVRVYQGELSLTGEIRSSEQAGTAERQGPVLQLTYQACQADRCLLPVSLPIRREDP